MNWDCAGALGTFVTTTRALTLLPPGWGGPGNLQVTSCGTGATCARCCARRPSSLRLRHPGSLSSRRCDGGRAVRAVVSQPRRHGHRRARPRFSPGVQAGPRRRGHSSSWQGRGARRRRGGGGQADTQRHEEGDGDRDCAGACARADHSPLPRTLATPRPNGVGAVPNRDPPPLRALRRRTTLCTR